MMLLDAASAALPGVVDGGGRGQNGRARSALLLALGFDFADQHGGRGGARGPLLQWIPRCFRSELDLDAELKQVRSAQAIAPRSTRFSSPIFSKFTPVVSIRNSQVIAAPTREVPTKM
jgi:hypothetical protein